MSATRFTAIVNRLTALPAAYASNEEFLALVANALQLEIWPVILHPSAYPTLWGRLEAGLLRARPGNPVRGAPLNTALLSVARAARQAQRDEEVFAALLAAAQDPGVSGEALSRGLGYMLVAAIWNDPALLD
jgi:hypothetical protein